MFPEILDRALFLLGTINMHTISPIIFLISGQWPYVAHRIFSISIKKVRGYYNTSGLDIVTFT